MYKPGAYLKLERLLETDQAAYSFIKGQHPELVHKWETLRKRMGKECPMARSVLKVIIANEKDNSKLQKALEEGKWNE